MAKLSPRAAKIKAASEVVYGKRGISQLAEASGISQQMLSFIVRGERTVSDDVYLKVAEALLKEAGRMHRVVTKVEGIAGKMFAELKE